MGFRQNSRQNPWDVSDKIPENKMEIAELMLVIVLLLVLLLVLVFWDDIYTPKNLGTWERSFEGECLSGQRTVSEFCLPDRITRRGCIEDGEMVYGTRLLSEPCGIAAEKSALLNTSKGVCTTSATPCAPVGTLGTRMVTVTCESTGNSGPIDCSALIPTVYTGPTGVSAPRYRIVELAPGDSRSYSESCNDFATPICGSFSGCPVDEVFHIRSACSTPLGVSEGTWLQPRICDGSTVCTDPSCSPVIPPASDVYNRTAVLPASICDPPSCLRLCRTQSTASGNTVYDYVLGYYLLLRIGTDTVVPISTPWPAPLGYNPGARSNAVTTDILGPVPLSVQSQATVLGSCDAPGTEFASALLVSFGYRSALTPNIFAGVISAYIGGQYLGFLSGQAATWVQTADGYDTPGLVSGEADLYEIEILGPPVPPPNPTPGGFSPGMVPLNITQGGIPVTVAGISVTNAWGILYALNTNIGQRLQGNCASYAQF